MQINYGRNTTKVYPDGSIRVISHEHSEIHEGRLFVASDYSTLAAAGDKRRIYIIPSGSDEAHFQFQVMADKAFSLWFTETPTVTGNGTDLVWYNVNRTSSNAATLSAFHTPAGPVSGDTILAAKLAGSNNPAVDLGGAAGNRVYEFILDPTKTYMLEVMARDTTVTVVVNMDYYESCTDDDMFAVE